MFAANKIMTGMSFYNLQPSTMSEVERKRGDASSGTISQERFVDAMQQSALARAPNPGWALHLGPILAWKDAAYKKRSETHILAEPFPQAL